MTKTERGSDRPISPRAIFANLWHPWDFIEAPTPNPQAQTHPSWRRVSAYCLSPGLLLDRWESSETLIGVSFSSDTDYLVLDVDRQSPHHPEIDEVSFYQLLAYLETIGLIRPLILRSSHSGGLHIYYPLPKKVSTWKLANLLANTLEKGGFPLKGGHLESFPNVKTWVPTGQGFSHYQAHRLPLQEGSVILDRDLIPEGADLNRFLTQWQWCANGQDIKRLSRALSKTRARQARPGPKGEALEYMRDLESTIEQGWVGDSETNSLLSLIARLGYIFRHHTGQGLVDFIANTARNLPGYRTFCGHQKDLEKRCRDWARSIEKSPKYFPYREKGKRQATSSSDRGPNNRERREEAIARLKQMMAQLEAEGQLATTTTDRANQLVALGISRSTLYQDIYRPLWHPEQYDPRELAHLVSDPAIAAPQLPKSEMAEIQPEQESSRESLRSVGRCADGEKEIKSTPRRGVAGGSEAPSSQPEVIQASPQQLLLNQFVALAEGRGREIFKQLLERTSQEKARLAIESYQEQAKKTSIGNPLAFLASALRQGWVPNHSPRRRKSALPKPAPVQLPSDSTSPQAANEIAEQVKKPSVGMPEWFKQRHGSLRPMQGT